MNSPLVSVIIPSYGRPDTLRQAVDSVISQTYKNIEIVVVDDNPPQSENREKTKKLVESIISTEKVIKYIALPQNMGGSLARNEGVYNSTGTLITFLDDDDYYLPQKVEKQVTVLQSGDIDICTCAMTAMDHGKVAKYIRSTPNGRTLNEFLLDGWAFTPMIMVKRDVFLKAKGFVHSPRFQDLLLMLRLLNVTSKHFILNEPLFVHNIYLGDRVSQSSKLRAAYEIRHKLENELSRCLTTTELQNLKKRQDMDLYDCDLFEATGIKKLNLIISKIKSSSSLKDLVFLIKFSLKKALRKNFLAWWIRRNLFSI